VTMIFCYGTLKRGWGNHARILVGRSTFVGEAVSVHPSFGMLDGPFPRVFECAIGDRVRGEVFDVDDEALAMCDELERHPEWYRREERTFALMPDGRQVTAWVYLMPFEGWMMTAAMRPNDEHVVSWDYRPSAPAPMPLARAMRLVVDMALSVATSDEDHDAIAVVKEAIADEFRDDEDDQFDEVDLADEEAKLEMLIRHEAPEKTIARQREIVARCREAVEGNDE